MCRDMKAVRAAAVLALLASAPCVADEGLSHTRPEVIDDLSHLDPGKVVSASYLFDSVVTNGGSASRGKYIPRVRGFVDLDRDGHEDVIVSAPLSSFGTGGGSYWMYLWTNGNYRCIGEFGSNPGWIKVEDEPRDGNRRIWTWSHSSATSGSIGSVTIWRDGFVENGRLPITTAGDGGPTSIGSELMDSVERHATVPVRWEQSVTTNGVNRWVSSRP